MIFDLHNDLFTSELSKKKQNNYLEINAGNMLILAFWTTKIKNPLKFIKSKIKKTGSNCPNKMFAIEDMHFADNNNINEIASLPLKYCTLCWRDNNRLAGGHKGESGLTEFGKKAIKILEKNNIAIDTAHLNKKSFYDILDNGSRVFNSHTCLAGINNHTRNLTDEQIKLLIEKKGIVAVTTAPEFMGKERANRRDYLTQLLSYADKFGVDTLSIGTDYFGTDQITGLESYNDFSHLRYELENNGLNNYDIDKIFFINALKFFN